MSVDSLLVEINKAGYLVTELYQRSMDEWFCVLRQRGDFSVGHGDGATAVEALGKAWAITPRNRMTNADWQKLKNPTRPKGSIPRIKP
jgi:hypothetical protein